MPHKEQERAAAESPLRLLVLCGGEPESERAFSGSARGLIGALERRGVVHHKANVLGWTDPFTAGPLPVRLWRRLDRLGLEERYRWSRFAFERNSRRASAIARQHPGFNACLLYGTNYRPALHVPMYCYFDATVAQVAAAAGWEFARFSPQHIAAIQAWQQEVFEGCACIFPRTRWAGQSVAEEYGVPAARILAAGAGANHLAEPKPHAPYDSQRILFIGTEFERKGGPLILDAFRMLKQDFPEATLAIVGCAPAIEEAGVEIIGRIRKDEAGGLDRLLEEYRRASLFCIMSHFEPFGIVIIEAQHSYVPCVVPARFAFTETVVDGQTGRHVAEYDPRLLAQTWAELFADPDRLRVMGQAAHDHVQSTWTWEAAAARIETRILADLAGVGD